MSPATVLNRILGITGLQPSTKRKATIWVELISLLVARDLRVRYRNSFFGYLWSMANPLLNMLILSVVFSHVMRVTIPNFPLFILSGIITWNLFSQSLAIGVNSILTNGALLKKVQVPAGIFPAASVSSVFVNYVLTLVPFLMLSIYFKGNIDSSILLLPVFLLPFLVFIFGIVLALSALNVSFRDIGHVLEPVLQAGFYATPIVYLESAIPEHLKPWLNLNPMVHFVRAFRQILFEQVPPSLVQFGTLSAIGLFSLALGSFVFTKRRHRFIYEI